MNVTQPLLHALVDIEPFLNFLALLVLLRTQAWKRFPAMTFYLGFRCLTDAGLFFIIKENRFFDVSARTQDLTYVYAYWACELIGAVAIFFVLQEIFKAVMEPVPGLQRLGLTMFRWAGFATVVILLGMTVLPIHRISFSANEAFLATVSLELMRCVSILEICLLAYLALSVHSLGRSFRGRVFGLGLGFGVEAAGELICSAIAKQGTIWSLANLFLMFAGTAALLIWTAYFLLPEPAEDKAPVTLPVTSPLLRWNAIASALGQRPAHIALGATSSAFFLQDVERVVDKFLAKSE